MKRKYKTTGCFKFLIFLIIFAPIAYFGASFIRGEDPIENGRNLIQFNTKKKEQDQGDVKVIDSEIDKLQEELKYKDRRIKELEAEVRDLQKQLDEG